MHDSKLSFRRRLRNVPPSVLAFYSMNMRCGCAPVFARTPTYFRGNPEHARAHGTNSRGKCMVDRLLGENMENIGVVIRMC